MSHKITLLASGMLAAMMLASSAAYADKYYTSPSSSYPAYGQDWRQGSINKAARHACRREIRNQIHSDRRHVQDIKFDKSSLDTREASHGKTKVKGHGRLLTGKQRWVEFDFKCKYDSYNNRLVRASYSKTSQDRHQAGFDQEMRQACNKEIFNHILRNHGSASHITIDDRNLRRWRESGAETGWSGEGRFLGGRGRTRHFEFSCIYNHRQRYTRNTWVTVH